MINQNTGLGSASHRFVNAVAIAAIVKELVDSRYQLLSDTSWLLDRVRAAELDQHEYAALATLCDQLQLHGLTLLRAVTTTAWE